MIRLPTMALSRPPAEPGGGVISVKTRSERPLKPSQSRAPRIEHEPAQAEQRSRQGQAAHDDALRRRRRL